MNVLELIEKLKEVQKDFEESDKEYYSKENDCDYKSPDVRLRIEVLEEEHGDYENYWMENVSYNSGSGYEVHPEVVLD
tara:strand:- start:334 stop:567 length:234 start_codon:yes stop_codon:yes gene_type:complete